MPELTQKQKDEYIEFDAGYCPVCNDAQMIMVELEHPSNILITQKCRCRGCGAEWSEQFAMNDVILTRGRIDGEDD